MSNLNFLHSGGNKVTLSAPASNPSSDITFKLPQTDGSSGPGFGHKWQWCTVVLQVKVQICWINTNNGD